MKPIVDGESRTIILYYDGENSPRVEVLFREEMLWMNQKQIAELFGVNRPAITKHLNNIFNEGELVQDSVCSKMEHTAEDGKTYQTQFYNLDAIISVGYRVNSERAIMFRNWATRVLKEYIQKGSVLDVERLKQPEYIFGQDYFDETLERIRDIRSSERRFYQKITDIYAQCSADYNKKSETTRDFFATVQNKLHWAIARQTAAEIVYGRADAKKTNMGLTTWKNAPKGAIRRPDVSIAKNYLDEKELSKLNLIVTMYLDYAELQAKNRQVMYMKDWVTKLYAFLQFNEQEILLDNGRVTHEIAKAFAEQEFDKYRAEQDRVLVSDFDEFLVLEGELAQ
jgi:hypothetical protein